MGLIIREHSNSRIFDRVLEVKSGHDFLFPEARRPHAETKGMDVGQVRVGVVNTASQSPGRARWKIAPLLVVLIKKARKFRFSPLGVLAYSPFCLGSTSREIGVGAV